jgi:hypothetical protein
MRLQLTDDDQDAVVTFAMEKLEGLLDETTGKFNRIHFQKDKLIKSLGLNAKETLSELTDKQLKEFINAAEHDRDCWELLMAYIDCERETVENISPLITAFCVDVTLAEIHAPKLKKTTDTRDFIFLFLAEVIVHKFGLGFSRSDGGRSNHEFTALDALAEASRKLKNFNEPLQFSTLSRLRTNNKFIAQLVDKNIKNRIGHTKRNRKTL